MEEKVELVIADDIKIQNLIYNVRGKQVMLDSDLAMLYQVETKTFNQAVKRNIERFQNDMMFQLSDNEVEYLRSHFVTANISSKSRSNPYVFTEQGVYMLMTVLKGELAVRQSIALVRTFKRMKDYILENRDLIGQRELLQLSMETANNRIEISKINSDLGKQLSVLNANLHQAETIKTRLEQQMDNLDVTDIHYDKKISDLQRRLDTQYDKIDEVEEAIATERLIIDRIIAKIYSII